jgi:aerobic-type carbon monoxide dehydrogenase small subunit (CoxS/CutS family)
VQQAILDRQAAQCGFCISGIVVRAAALLDEQPHPDEDAVVAALDKNLCRCGVQRRIVAAVVAAGGEQA